MFVRPGGRGKFPLLTPHLDHDGQIRSGVRLPAPIARLAIGDEHGVIVEELEREAVRQPRVMRGTLVLSVGLAQAGV